MDPSGGGPDAFTASVIHTEGAGADLRVVQDVLKGWATRSRETVDLEAIVAEIADIAKRYKVRVVYGDRYSREWVAQSFERRGLTYVSDHRPPLDKSAAYLETEPLFTQGRIEILDHQVQRRELMNLERRPRPGNKASVDHPTSAGAHDDFANALALATAVTVRNRRPMLEGFCGPAENIDPASEEGRPFLWTCACGVQRTVAPAEEKPVGVDAAGKPKFRCLRCDPQWTWATVARQ